MAKKWWRETWLADAWDWKPPPPITPDVLDILRGIAPQEIPMAEWLGPALAREVGLIDG